MSLSASTVVAAMLRSATTRSACSVSASRITVGSASTSVSDVICAWRNDGSIRPAHGWGAEHQGAERRDGGRTSGGQARGAAAVSSGEDHGKLLSKKEPSPWR